MPSSSSKHRFESIRQTSYLLHTRYDELGRMSLAALAVADVEGPRATLSYNDLGQLTGIVRRLGASGPAVTSSYNYDELGRLAALTHSSATAGPLAEYSFGYDAHGRLVSYSGPDGSLDYSYDATGQLLAASGDRHEDYSYDAAGNRTMTGYVTGDNNRLLSDGLFDYEYDAEGNRTRRTEIASGEVTEYTWDHRNRLVGVVVRDSQDNVVRRAEFTYDAFDRLLVRWLDEDGDGAGQARETLTLYDSSGRSDYGRPLDDVLAEFGRDEGGAWSLTSRYLYGPAVDQLLAAWENASGLPLGAAPESWPADAAAAFHLADHLGSVRQVVDGSSGQVINEVVYDSFGNVLSESNAEAAGRFKYTAREWFDSLGLQYNRARWYDPAVGRWLSEDPIADDLLNDYRYVGNGPLDATDPSGLQELPADEAIRLGQLRVRQWQQQRLLELTQQYEQAWASHAANPSWATQQDIFKARDALKNAGVYLGNERLGHYYRLLKGEPTELDRSLASSLEMLRGIAAGMGETVVATAIATVVIGGIGLVSTPIALTAGGALLVYGISQPALERLADGQSGLQIAGGTLSDISGVSASFAAWTNKDLVTGKQLQLSDFDRGRAAAIGATQVGGVLVIGGTFLRYKGLRDPLGQRMRDLAKDENGFLGPQAPGVIQRFRSFSALKRALGSAGEGNVWHHIVEQTPGNVARFGPEAIHNTQNVIRLSATINQRIANYYSSIRPFTGGRTVRAWLAAQSLDAQEAFGRRILQILLSGGTLP